MLINPPTWTQNGSYTAEQDRRLIGSIVRTEGVANATNMVPSVVANSRQISVSAGGAYIQGDYTNGGGGMYFAYNDGAFEVAIPGAGTTARYDLIVLRVYDSAVSGSANEVRFDVITGTPAASPRIPSVPRSAIAIAAVKVNPGAATLTAGTLSDQRTISQMNGAITGNVNTTQAARLNQIASPTNPVLITPAGSPNDLQISTGGGFQAVGGANIYSKFSDLPKSAPAGTIATITSTGRTYQYRSGMWKFFHGWGPYVTTGLTKNVSHTGPYIGNMTLNVGGGSGFGSEKPRSSSDVSTYYTLTKGTSGTTQSRGGGITFRRPGIYHVELKYQLIGLRAGTAVRSRLNASGISQFTAADNQESYNIIGKGQELIVTTSGTVTVSSTSASTHGKLLPWLRTSSSVTLGTVIMSAEMQYEF